MGYRGELYSATEDQPLEWILILYFTFHIIKKNNTSQIKRFVKVLDVVLFDFGLQVYPNQKC